jgi:hypothetical protein
MCIVSKIWTAELLSLDLFVHMYHVYTVQVSQSMFAFVLGTFHLTDSIVFKHSWWVARHDWLKIYKMHIDVLFVAD